MHCSHHLFIATLFFRFLFLLKQKKTQSLTACTTKTKKSIWILFVQLCRQGIKSCFFLSPFLFHYQMNVNAAVTVTDRNNFLRNKKIRSSLNPMWKCRLRGNALFSVRPSSKNSKAHYSALSEMSILPNESQSVYEYECIISLNGIVNTVRELIKTIEHFIKEFQVQFRPVHDIRQIDYQTKNIITMESLRSRRNKNCRIIWVDAIAALSPKQKVCKS